MGCKTTKQEQRPSLTNKGGKRKLTQRPSFNNTSNTRLTRKQSLYRGSDVHSERRQTAVETFMGGNKTNLPLSPLKNVLILRRDSVTNTYIRDKRRPSSIEADYFLVAEQVFSQMRYLEAYNNFVSASQSGHPEATYNVAVMLAVGFKGVPRDVEAAKNMYNKAMDLGVASAGYNLGIIYFVEKNFNDALRCFEHAALLGHDKAAFNAGVMNCEGVGGEPNQGKTFQFLKEASLADLACASYNLGVLYRDGMGSVSSDLSMALEYLSRAAFGGDADGFFALGEMHEIGLGVEYDRVKAEFFYKQGALFKHPGCQEKYRSLTGKNVYQ